MVIEVARTRALQKPWGTLDPRPWIDVDHTGRSIGELCYERSTAGAVEPALLLKVLLTTQPLSIQVHPDDDFAQSIGLPRGKTEAWYVLEAKPGAAVAVGLKQALTPEQLRQAIDDGSIADLVAWRAVSAGDTVFVPAGTIHAIGPGLVIAEIQQRSDATFRLFDFGRTRELHVENAVAVARPAPDSAQVLPRRLDNGRTLLASSLHFAYERVELEQDSSWHLDATKETWIIVLSGSARAGSHDVVKGEAIFAEAEMISVEAGAAGVVCLVAYAGRDGPIKKLLRRAGPQRATASRRPADTRPPELSIGAGR